jgi:hypothetical protein
MSYINYMLTFPCCIKKSKNRLRRKAFPKKKKSKNKEQENNSGEIINYRRITQSDVLKLFSPCDSNPGITAEYVLSSHD